jgi:hypothetical protein
VNGPFRPGGLDNMEPVFVEGAIRIGVPVARLGTSQRSVCPHGRK